MLSFFVSLVPPTATHHSKKIVRRGAFTKLADTSALTDARAVWFAALQPHAPPEPMVGPLALSMTFVWPWLKGHPAKTRELEAVVKTTKPDCSNMAKSVEDIMAVLRFFENDAQVVQLTVRKYHGSKPGLYVRLEPARISPWVMEAAA